MVAVRQNWRVDPANMAVRTAVHDIEAPMAGMAKNENGSTGQIKLQHCFADRKPLQCCGGFRNDNRIELRHLLFAFLLWRRDDIAGRFDKRAISADVASPGSMTILETSLVTPQASFDAHRRLVGAGISVGVQGLGLERYAGREVNRAFRAKAEPLERHRHVAGIAAMEMFGERFNNPRIHPLA